MAGAVFGMEDDNVTPFFEAELAKYSSPSEANLMLCSANSKDLSVLYINIVSLYSNFDEFSNLLTNFDEKIDLILLSETKITEECNIPSIIHT